MLHILKFLMISTLEQMSTAVQFQGAFVSDIWTAAIFKHEQLGKYVWCIQRRLKLGPCMILDGTIRYDIPHHVVCYIGASSIYN